MGVDIVCTACHDVYMTNTYRNRPHTQRARARRHLRKPVVPPYAPEFETREQWLVALKEAIAPWYGGNLPPVRVSIGFPSGGKRGKAIGECWSQKCDAGGACQIFVHPGQEKPEDVAAILAHELIHAAVGIDAKHGPAFKEMALRIGLQGPMRATTAGPAFLADIAPILAELGPIPHAALRHGYTVKPKQSTRMLKCQCSCGYIVRTTKKWVDVAVPVCPVCFVSMDVDQPAEEG